MATSPQTQIAKLPSDWHSMLRGSHKLGKFPQVSTDPVQNPLTKSTKSGMNRSHLQNAIAFLRDIDY